MTRYDAHVCLVSAQATPNLLPVLDAQWQPRRVVLAASPKMAAAAKALEGVIKRKGLGITVETLELPDAYDYAALSEVFLSYLANHAEESLALNVTGGTKLMAVAAQEAFRAADQAVLYVNVESDEVIVIGEQARRQPLKAQLKVRELLESHGYTVEQQQHPAVTASQRDVCARVIDHIHGAGGRALGQVNRLAVQARERPHMEVKLTESQLDSRALGDLLGLFQDAEQLNLRGDVVKFANEAARSFVNGGWLESHVFQTLGDLRGEDTARITDVVMNATVVHPDGRTRNEIDIAFLFRNTLHLIECKTANLASEGAGGDDKATEAIYKMETLLKLGGLRTRGMIVDYRGALSAHKANLDRAKAAGIDVVSGLQLRDLKGHVRRVWLSR